MEISLNQIEKCSAVPIPFGLDKPPALPFRLTDNVDVDSLEGRLQPDNFAVWDRFAPKEAIEWFTKMDVALLHRFYSSDLIGPKDEDSKDLLRKVFVCLRLVKPTRTPFAVVQFKKKSERHLDVLSFTYAADPVSLILPESEVLNHFSPDDLVRLRGLLPKFFKVDASPGAQHVRRAIRYYETGYEEIRDTVLQFTVWMMGIESLYSLGEEQYEPDKVRQRIRADLGSEDIYRDFADRDLYHAEKIEVKDIVDDLFHLRNLFIHGRWVPDEWIKRRVRMSISGPGINYADVLRESASFILRAGLLKALNRAV